MHRHRLSRTSLLPALLLSSVAIAASLTAAVTLTLAVTPDPATAATTVASNSVQAWGTSQLGDLSGKSLNQPIVGMAATPDGGGYWLVASDGGIFTFGDAQFHGSAGSIQLNAPIVGMAADPATGGYWMVASDGGVFAYDAPFDGSTGGQPLNAPIVGMAATPDGGGYWLVASDGGIFSFGTAPFDGSTGSLRLNAPVVGMAADPTGGGYWLVASDGGVFTFGTAPFDGSTGSLILNAPVVSMAATGDGGGYWMVASDGGVFSFGDAPFDGTALSAPSAPAIAITDGGTGAPTGYRVAYGEADSPFGPAVANEIALQSGTATVTAALYNAVTGATWVLDPGQLEDTASIVKVEIMATALQEAQQSGQPLPAAEAALMPSMIEQSDNDSATSLWNDVGGPDAIARYNQNLGLTSTTPSGVTGTPYPGWGLTTTTAADQVTLLNHLAFPNGQLTNASRAYALSLMEQVEPAQDWGVSAGVPAGVTVALKNGWLPLNGNSDWQVNSIGWISGDGRDYTLAILTGGSPSEGYGIATIQAIASTVYAEMAPR